MANEPFARRLTLRKAGQVKLLGETPNQLGANRSCRPPRRCQNYFLAKKGKIIKPRIAQISGVQQDCRFEFEKCGQLLSAHTGHWNESPGVDSNKVSRLTPVLEQVCSFKEPSPPKLYGLGGGVGRGLGVGANLGVGVGLAVDVGVGETVAVAVAVGVDVGVGEAVLVAVAVAVGVDVGVEEAVLVAVDVGLGVGVGVPDCAQYLPPVLNLPRTPPPPQIIISLPVHTAVCKVRASGALIVLVAVQLSLPGSYLPPVLRTRGKPSSPPQTIISLPVHTAV
jgi:hypothetical protein